MGTVATWAQTASAVCWSKADGAEVCVPLSVMRATFPNGYATGDPSPLHLAQQNVLAVQIQYAQELEARRQCEGTLGPLQAKAHAAVLSEQQDRLTAAEAEAAPPGMTWDAKTRRYVVTPAKEGQ
jgi:hypothetical protein